MLHCFYPCGSQFRIAGTSGVTLPIIVSREASEARVSSAEVDLRKCQSGSDHPAYVVLLSAFTMRNTKTILKSGVFLAVAVCAAEVSAGKLKVEAAIAVDKDTRPTTTFAADVPKLYTFFKTNGSKAGDSLRAVWIAEDVGEAAPKNTKIDESTLTADQDDFYGAFSLTKPTKGWPAGKYRVEIYVGDQLETTAKFTIKAGKSHEESDDDSNDDSSDE